MFLFIFLFPLKYQTRYNNSNNNTMLLEDFFNLTLIKSFHLYRCLLCRGERFIWLLKICWVISNSELIEYHWKVVIRLPDQKGFLHRACKLFKGLKKKGILDF